jgi:hypothetical protein
MIDKLEYVKEKLQGAVLVRVAANTCVSMRTLSNIKSGKDARAATVDVLHRYFKRKEKK